MDRSDSVPVLGQDLKSYCMIPLSLASLHSPLELLSPVALGAALAACAQEKHHWSEALMTPLQACIQKHS